MDVKYYSWLFLLLAFLTHVLGIFKLLLLFVGLTFFFLGCLCVIYIQRGDLDQFLISSNLRNPLETPKTLGLNLVCDQKPIVLITPNIDIQMESKSRRKSSLPYQNQMAYQHDLNHQQPKWYSHHQSDQQQRHHHSNPLHQLHLNYFLNHLSIHNNQHHQHKDHHQRKFASQSAVSSMCLETRKKSLIDSGIDLLFKKHNRHGKEGGHLKSHDMLHCKDNTILSGSNRHSPGEEKKWKPFENIKIYTDKKANAKNSSHTQNNRASSAGGNSGGEQVQFGEECTGPAPYKYNVTLSTDAHLLDEHGSPKKKQKAMLSGNKQIDQLLHNIIDYILRDFINSWFCSLSNNKEFSDFRVRNCIEKCVSNLCNRVKNTHWIPLMTTRLIDNVANHTRMYRLANQAINTQAKDSVSIGGKMKLSDRVSPQRKSKKSQHKRNKSDTDLDWYHFGGNPPGKTGVNGKFNTESLPPDDKPPAPNPEIDLLNAFFQQNSIYKDECLDERKLEKYLTHVMETILYFTLPDEDFACIPLRTFLSTLLANVIFKPLLHMLSDPDFINLQVAKVFSKDPPPVEYFLKSLRQSTDLSELRACRQLITKEMNLKYKDPNAAAELASLKYSQKLIDLRINYLQNTKDSNVGDASGTSGIVADRVDAKLPILSLDELLFKELARSYFLDYLSVLNLQKYVIFYLTADEWRLLTAQALADVHANKTKSSKEEIYRNIRDKAYNIFKEYLIAPSQNALDIDRGLIEAVSIKLKDSSIHPESNWFDSICKFVYEKLKNEEIFLAKFYQSSAYRKLLLELEFVGQNHDAEIELNMTQLHINSETGSDSNSGDLIFDDDTDTDCMEKRSDENTLSVSPAISKVDLLDVTGFKHARSRSDCTGLAPSYSDSSLESRDTKKEKFRDQSPQGILGNGCTQIDLAVNREQMSIPVPRLNLDRPHSAPSRNPNANSNLRDAAEGFESSATELAAQMKQKLMAKIINTAILCEGQYAVYAVQVAIIEDNQHKSWHIYRRYSKFLELKKLIIKKYPSVAKIPFPAKKAFQNTQRSVLEHRMVMLNEFLRILCLWAEDNEDMMRTLREFFEPDTDDRKIHGGAVIRTIETLVNPLKTGMRTIRNMPDTLVGGFSKILLGKGPLKEATFLEVNPISLEQSSEYPALTSALHLLDEVFDLQARSQWLRRGIINRLLGAPWVSHTANKKIVHAAKAMIDVDKIEQLLSIILKTIWPDGKRQKRSNSREDNTKLRTKVAARMALFALLSDDLKHVVGSETTRSGLLNIFSMWQNSKLNLRLALVLLNDILTNLYRIDNITKHVKD